MQTCRVDGTLGGTCVDDRLQAGIDVEVASIGRIGPELDSAGAPRTRRATASEVEEQFGAESPGQLPQRRVGRTGQIGEQRERGVGILVHRPIERLLVELADLG